MKPFIYNRKKDIHIIDLKKATLQFNAVYDEIKELAKTGEILFVGTKKQAAESIAEQANRAGMPYINSRWLGGTLTNFKTIRLRVYRLTEIEKYRENGIYDSLPKKEQIKMDKEYDKLNKNLGGIREMKAVPKALFIVDPVEEEIAVNEAIKLNIPVIATADTNTNPDVIDHILPTNDDAIKAVKLMSTFVANAILEVNGGTVIDLSKEKPRNFEMDKTRKPIIRPRVAAVAK